MPYDFALYMQRRRGRLMTWRELEREPPWRLQLDLWYEALLSEAAAAKAAAQSPQKAL